jgi:peptide/nickel transport system substrate-binding protein
MDDEIWNEAWESSRRDFLKLGGAAVLTGGILSRLLEAGTAEAAAAAAVKGSTTLTIGVASDPQTLDPEWGQAARANETIKNIYSQWVRYKRVDSKRGYLIADLKNVEGEALESFTVSPDGRTIRAKVRKATLPSGKPLTADDFIYKVQRSIGVNGGSVFDFNILGITNVSQVKKLSAREFQITLPNPTAILGPMLRDQDAGLVDTSLVEAQNTSSDPWGQKWIARNGAPTGAYVIKEYTPGTRLVLQANPRYWRSKPFFTTVILQVIPSSDDRALLLKNGSIDIAEDLSTEAAIQLKGAGGVRVLSVPSIKQHKFGFVMDKAPFEDRRLRQAIAYAIPYQPLLSKVLHSEAVLANGVWPRNSVWATPGNWPYKYDPAKAKSMLAAAGKANGFSFTVDYSQSDADAQALAVPIQTALKDVGITMNINTVAPSAFGARLNNHVGQAFIRTSSGVFVDDPYYHVYLYFTSKAVLNWWAYHSPGFDKIVNQMSSAQTAARKKHFARLAQKQLNFDIPMISLGEPNFLLPMRKDLAGVVYEPDGLLIYNALKRTG